MARKSGSTISQEELYPTGRRAQCAKNWMMRACWTWMGNRNRHSCADKSVSPSAAVRLPKKTATRLTWGAIASAWSFFCVVGVAALYHYGEHSWRFRVESSDDIEIAGLQNVTRAQVMEVMGGDIGRNIFFVPLAQRKAQLEQIPWVESASVMRFVPNRICEVQIHERTPVAFARVGSKILLIDACGHPDGIARRQKEIFLSRDSGDERRRAAFDSRGAHEDLQRFHQPARFRRRALFAGPQRSGSVRSGRCEGARQRSLTERCWFIWDRRNISSATRFTSLTCRSGGSSSTNWNRWTCATTGRSS